MAYQFLQAVQDRDPPSTVAPSLLPNATNLCVPVAFSIFCAFHNLKGNLPRLPSGIDYPVNNTVFDTPGWLDFVYDGPNMRQHHPINYDGLNITSAYYPSLDFFFNTNNRGDSSLKTTDFGTLLENALIGGHRFFENSQLRSHVGYSYHRRNGTQQLYDAVGRQPPSFMNGGSTDTTMLLRGIKVHSVVAHALHTHTTPEKSCTNTTLATSAYIAPCLSPLLSRSFSMQASQ